MSTKDVDVLIREARNAGLRVELVNGKWRVTSDTSDGQAFIPTRATGRGLANARSAIRRLADPPAPMVAAVNPTLEEDAVGWPIEQLLAMAEQQGVRVEVRGGLLHVSGPVDAEPFARLLRDREADVLDHLNPSTESENSVPKIGEVARISGRLPSDAKAVWEILRENAANAGDEAGTNAGIDGVLWRGARDPVLRTLGPEWSKEYRADIGSYLEQTGHAKCQSRHATPPIWWIADVWNDGSLTVTKKSAASNGRAAAQFTDDELIAAVTERIRASANTARIAELETANEALRSHIKKLTEQLAEREGRLAQYEAAAAIFRGGTL